MERKPNMEDWMKNISFVGQNDIVFETLTVFETIEYAAEFRTKKEGKNLTAEIENLLMKLSLLIYQKVR